MIRALLISAFLACLAIPATGVQAAGQGVSIHVSVGYNGYYRESTWTPVRVSLVNGSPDVLEGQVTVQGAAEAPRAARYAEPVALAPGARKVVTLYVPGADIQGTVSAFFDDGSTHVSDTAYPNPFGDTDLVVGAVSDDPESTPWLRTIRPARAPLRVVPLASGSLDTSAEALATFDAIVLTNVDTSRLDSDQIAALQRYVAIGGSLILVGGATWQQTLSGLPSDLVPGRLTGTRNLHDLHGVGALGYGTPPARMLAVTSLAHPRGVVLASQSGLPLVVKSGYGNGQIEYVAFDPSAPPVAGWSASTRLLTWLVSGAAPLGMRRAGLLPVDRATSFLNPGPEPVDLAMELDNLATPPLRTILILPALVLGLIILVVAGGIVIFRRWHWRPMTWAGTGILLAAAAVAALSLQPLARQGAVINTLNVVDMQGGTVHPADRYVSLLSPVSGNYTLSYDNSAEVNDLLPLQIFGGVPPSPEAATFTEGPRTAIELPNVQTWTTRAVQLRTTMQIPGRIATNLHLDSRGRIVGMVVNRTSVPLLRPALIAGQAYARLPDIAPGGHAAVSLYPRSEVTDHEYTQMLTQVYGLTLPDYSAMVVNRSVSIPGNPAGIPADRTLARRIRNAVNALPESHLLSAIGEVTLVAWTDQPLDSIELDGAAASHRDLTLLVQPVTVSAARGRFLLPTGVIGARPVDMQPAAPEYPCGGVTPQPFALGPGSEATFAFQLPRGRYSALSLDLYAGGIDPTTSDYTGVPRNAVEAYDWRAQRWIPLSFHSYSSHFVKPARFISYTGAVLVRVRSTQRIGDLTILDPRADLQIHGTGMA